MKIEQLYKLPLDSESLKDIDLYINNATVNTQDYFKAIVLKVEIIAKSDVNKALKLIYSYVALFNQLEDEATVVIIDEILKLTLFCKRYDEYEKFLQIKENRLDFKNDYLIHKDRFLLNVELNNFREAKDNLNKYLLYNIKPNEKVDLLYKYLRLCFDSGEQEEFNHTIDLLRSSIFDVLNPKLEEDVNVLEVLFKAKTKKEDSFKSALSLIEHKNLRDFQYLLLSSIIMNHYIDEGSLKAASLVESEYSYLLANSISVNYKKPFILESIRLYTLLGHNVSIEFYNKELKKLNEEVINHQETYVIPETEIKEDDTTKSNVIKVRKVLRNNLNIDVDKYLNIYNELIISGSIKDNAPREYIRELLITLSKYTKLKYMNVIKSISNNYYIYTFKNGKVYDREYDDITDLYEYNVITSSGDYFNISSDLNDLKLYTKGINYEHIYKFYINNDTYLLVYSSDKDIDYNLCEFTARLIALRFEYNTSKEDYNHYLELLNFIFKSSKSGIKEINGDTIINNPYIDNIYRQTIRSNKELYAYLTVEDVNKYKNVLNDLFNTPTLGKEIIYKYSYDYHDYYIKETFYPYLTNNEYKLYSYVNDITNTYETNNKLEKLLYYNLESNLYNKNKFILDVTNNINNKYTLILFSLKDYELYNSIYYTSFHNDYIRSVAEYLSNFNNSHNYASFYQYSDNKFAGMFKLDIDKRTITKIIKDFIKGLEILDITIKYNIDAHFAIGAFRIKDYICNEYKEVYHYLNNAYIMAKSYDDNENSLVFYNHQNYELYYEDKMLEHNINNFINHNKFNIGYKQIINVKELSVEGYLAEINLNNEIFDNDKINKIIEYRDLKLKIEKYKLLKIFNDLKILYQQVKGLIEVYIHIDNLLINDNILELVSSHLRFFKLSGSFIKFIVDEYNPKLDDLKKYNIECYTKNIYDIINRKLDNVVLDASLININELDNLLLFLNNYHVKVLLLNAQTLKEASKTNIKYITSKDHKKVFTITDIIDNILE